MHALCLCPAAIDYVMPPLVYKFEPGHTRICANIVILDDNLVEDTEYFNISLNSLDGTTGPAMVTIKDNDGKFPRSDLDCKCVGTSLSLSLSSGATISLETTSVSVGEGDEGMTTAVEICVKLSDVMEGLERDVVVNLNTVEGTAGTQHKRFAILHSPSARSLSAWADITIPCTVYYRYGYHGKGV